MINTMTRAFFTKLALIVAAMVAINHYAVRPKAHAMGEVMDEYRSQAEFLQTGLIAMEQSGHEIERFNEHIADIQAKMLRELQPDPTILAHQRLHRFASARDLTVTRVEPLRSTIKKSNDGGVLTNPIAIDTKDFKMECHGAFHSVLSLIADIQSGPHHAQVTSFRMVPISEEAVRVVMQVRLTELKAFSDALQP